MILCELCGLCVLPDLAQEARPVRQSTDPEDLRERLAQIGERGSRSEIDSGAQLPAGWSVEQWRSAQADHSSAALEPAPCAPVTRSGTYSRE